MLGLKLQYIEPERIEIQHQQKKFDDFEMNYKEQASVKVYCVHTTTVAKGAIEKPFPSVSTISTFMLCLLTKQRTKTAIPTPASSTSFTTRTQKCYHLENFL